MAGRDRLYRGRTVRRAERPSRPRILCPRPSLLGIETQPLCTRSEARLNMCPSSYQASSQTHVRLNKRGSNRRRRSRRRAWRRSPCRDHLLPAPTKTKVARHVELPRERLEASVSASRRSGERRPSSRLGWVSIGRDEREGSAGGGVRTAGKA